MTRDRYAQCDDTCTTDCGACKGAGPPANINERHDPALYSAGRHGSWCTCSCGWTSDAYRRVTGAHLAYGEHLLEANR